MEVETLSDDGHQHVDRDSNPDLCLELGIKGREYAREHFSMHSFAGRVDKILALAADHNPTLPMEATLPN